MKKPLPSILIINNDDNTMDDLKTMLNKDFDVFLVTNVMAAHLILKHQWIQVVLCNQHIPEVTGLKFCHQLRIEYPDIIRMIICNCEATKDISEAIKNKVIYQFITSPWQPCEIIDKLNNAIELFDLQRELEQLKIELQLKPDRIEQTMLEKRQTLQNRYEWDMGINRSPESPINHICNKIRNIAPYDVNVLLIGESGTDKVSYARAIHDNSMRQGNKYISLNCAGMSDELLERQLFGYKHGTNLNAKEDKNGLFLKANGGTLYLNEINQTSTIFQLKILQVLLDGQIYVVGSNRAIPVDVRIIAATDQNLNEKLIDGTFRSDLYYRIAVFDIEIPPLRKRKQDIIPIALSLLNQNMELLGKKVNGISDEALQIFENYQWPGNIVEMNNEIKRMLVLGQGDYLSSDSISSHILHATPKESKNDIEYLVNTSGSLKERMESLEAILVKETLIKSRWNQTKAAALLGLSRVGLRNKIERYGLENNKKVIPMDDIT